MGKLLKILLGLAVGLIALVAIALVVVPKLIDAEKIKGIVISKTAEITGREVALDGDLSISVFPWIGVQFSDFRLGNPDGFESETFVKVKSFEAHVKFMPLLQKEVEVESFILDSPEIYLEKRKDGVANWQGLGGSGEKKEPAKEEKEQKAAGEGVGLKSIEVGSFVINNATLKYSDKEQGTAQEITGFTLQLTDVSLVRPITLFLEAVIDGKKIGLDGTIGPLGDTPGQGVLPLQLAVNGLDTLKVNLDGQLTNPATDLAYDLNINIPSFSLRSLLGKLGMGDAVVTSDPKVLEAIGANMQVKGSATQVAIPDGQFTLDDSTLKFNLEAKRFAPLNLLFAGKLDAIDLNRYLPPATQSQGAKAGNAGNGGKSTGEGQPDKGGTDYAPLRALTLDTSLEIGELKIQGGKAENIVVKLVADKGLFQLKPLDLDLYGGKVDSSAEVNFKGKKPATSLDLKTTGVQVGPLLRDFANKDVLEGTLASTMTLSMKGDEPIGIKKTLNGKGELIFADGAIVGIDLAGMVRNVKASFGMGEKATERPKTDFAELKAPFTLKNGLFTTPGTTMQSPLLRVNVAGDANLVTEALDMKVDPKFVATLKGQGDTKARKGIMVPVIVGGTFSKPTFTPDLAAILQGELPDVNEIKKTLEEGLAPDKVLPKDKSIEEGIKNLIPGLKIN